jgi:hypothetical protein
MRRSSDRGQTEPFAAVAAVLAVSVGMTVYAGVLDDSVPAPPDRRIATETLDAVERAAETAGIVDPAAVEGSVGPDGWRVNLTLRAGGHRWCIGPEPPTGDSDSLTRSTRPVSVRLEPGRVRPGNLEAVVWQ